MNKKPASQRVKNDVTNAIRLKLNERMNKRQIIEFVVTSYGRKILTDEIKNIAGRVPEKTKSYPPKKLAFQIANISLQNASRRRKQKVLSQRTKEILPEETNKKLGKFSSFSMHYNCIYKKKTIVSCNENKSSNRISAKP